MSCNEKKYFLNNVLWISISAIVTVILIVSIGIYALSTDIKTDQPLQHKSAMQQSGKTVSLMSDLAYNHTKNNTDKAFAIIDNYLKSNVGFRLIPNIDFEDISLENLPELYFNNIKICDKASEDNFAERLKNLTGSDIYIYQRLNRAGDMFLLCSSLNNLPNNFNLRYLNAYESDNRNNPLISTVFRGQIFHSVQNFDGTILSLSFRRIIDRRGNILGMLVISTKLSGIVDFDSQFFAGKYTIIDNLTKQKIIDVNKSNNKHNNFLSWTDSVSQSLVKDREAYFDFSLGKIAYNDSRMQWTIAMELLIAPEPIPSGLKENGIKMALSAGLIVVIIIIIVSIRQSDKFQKKMLKREQCLKDSLNIIISGNYSAFENDIALQSFSENNCYSELPFDILELLRKTNNKLFELEKDKADLTNIIDSIGMKIEQSIVNFYNDKDDTIEVLNSGIDKFSEMSVRITQVATALNELSLWDSFSEMAAKLQRESGADKINERVQNLRIKAGIIGDKIEKIFYELNSIKKISDHAYLISINSAIFAEKGNSGKLGLLSEEVRRLSESLSNSADQVFYLLSEGKNAIQSCSTDIEKIGEVAVKIPKQSDISQLLADISKFNERISSLSHRISAINDEGRSALKVLEAGKSSVLKSSSNINELKNIKDQLV